MLKIIEFYLNSKNLLNIRMLKYHIEDRGLQFADSVYEVVCHFIIKIIDLKFHFKRLRIFS